VQVQRLAALHIAAHNQSRRLYLSTLAATHNSLRLCAYSWQDTQLTTLFPSDCSACLSICTHTRLDALFSLQQSDVAPTRTCFIALHQVGSGSLSYLLTWHGSQQQLRPVLFLSHIDVVPVTAETLQVRTTAHHG
jgi:hypothetical protein